MTVSQLIETLQRFPSGLRVIVAGYEGGFLDLEGVQLKSIRLNVHNQWYYGPHELADNEYWKKDPDKGEEDAILLGHEEHS